MRWAFELLVIFLSLGGYAFFAGMETGVISIHRMRLRHFVRQGSSGTALLENYLQQSDRLFGTTLVGTNVCLVIISVISASLAARTLGPWGEAFSTALATVVVLVFCEFLPKAWFHSRPLERCRRFVGLLRFWEWAFLPISFAVVRITRLLIPGPSRAFSTPAPFVTREDLKALAREGEKDGVLSPRERLMINRVLELATSRARQIMIPSEAMTTVTGDVTVAEFLETARRSGFTRVPVSDRESGRFIGVVNVFHVLSAHPDNDARPIREFARPPLFISENMPLDEIFPRLRRFRQPLALVVKGESDVIGLLTTEDILRAIVGRL